jgi:hypothetical protein
MTFGPVEKELTMQALLTALEVAEGQFPAYIIEALPGGR